MNVKGIYLVGLFTLVGCYRQDPVVRAAQDLQRMAYDFAAEEEERRARVNSLRLGMSDSEVIKAIGPPDTRQSIASSAEESREIWTYRGGLQPLATLTFTNQRLTAMRVE
jgi:hypothetical protein